MDLPPGSAPDSWREALERIPAAPATAALRLGGLRALALRNAALVGVAVPLGLYVLAAALLLVQIGDHPPFPYNWEDATARQFFAFWEHPSAAIFQFTQGLMTDSGDSPLLALPAWLAWALGGESVAALRAPTALLAALAVPLLWLLGRRLAGAPAATLAACLLALSPVFLLYGRTATTVGLSLVPGLVTIYVLIRALEPGARWRWLLALPLLLVLDSYAYAPIRFLWPLSLGLLTLALVRSRWGRLRLLPVLLITLLALPAAILALERESGPSLVSALAEYYNGRGEQIGAVLTYPEEYMPDLLGVKDSTPAQVGPGTLLELFARVVTVNAADYGRLLLDWNTKPALTDYWNPQGRLYPLGLVPFFLAGLGAAAWGARRRVADRYVLLFFFAFGLPMLLTSRVHIGRLIFVLPFLCLLVAQGYLLVATFVTARLARRIRPAWGTRLQRRGPMLGAAVLLTAVAWATWVDYSPLPPPPQGEPAVADLRVTAATWPPGGGVALVLGDAQNYDLETVEVAGYRLELDHTYRFVDLAAGPSPAAPPADSRPPLYFGALLDVLAHPEQMPGLCDNLYYVAPAVQARFDQADTLARARCGHDLHTIPLAQ